MASTSPVVITLAPSPSQLSGGIIQIPDTIRKQTSRQTPDTVIIIREKKPASLGQKSELRTNIQPTAKPKLEALGLVGLLLGTAGLFIAGIPLGTAAVILGIVSLVKFQKHPQKFKGRGFAIAALIVGLLAIIGAIIVLGM